MHTVKAVQSFSHTCEIATARMFGNTFTFPVLSTIALSCCHLDSYSAANALFFIWAIFVDNRLKPFVTCSTVATATTWYLALLADRSLLSKMMVKQAVPGIVFLIGDIVLHALPLLHVLINRHEAVTVMRDYAHADKTVQFCGWCSLFVHLFWYHVNKTDLNTMYVPASPYFWDFTFSVASACHVAVMVWLRLLSAS